MQQVNRYFGVLMNLKQCTGSLNSDVVLICNKQAVLDTSRQYREVAQTPPCRVRNLKFARNLKFTTSKTLVNFMKKMMFLS